MTEYLCSDLLGLFLLITKIGKNQKIKYLLYTNIYNEYTANMPKELVEELLKIFSIKYELIYLECHVPVISKRTRFNVWYQRYQSKNKIICPYNTYPAVRTNKEVELIYDPQSFISKSQQDKKGNFIYKVLRFLYRKLKYSKLNKNINLISPHETFFDDCKKLWLGKSNINIFSCNSFWMVFKDLNYINTNIKSIKKRLLDHKPNYIYLPCAEINEDQFYKLFKLQTQNIEIGSRIFIKPHPRDNRNYSKLIDKIDLKDRYKILFFSDNEHSRFFPLELILSWLDYEVKLFGQCASTNYFYAKNLNKFCYGYQEPQLSEFKEDYNFLHEIYSYEPILLGEH